MTKAKQGEYVAVRADGTQTRHVSREALARATKRSHGPRLIVDSWRAENPPPFGSSDAAEWDAYRTRHGYSGTR